MLNNTNRMASRGRIGVMGRGADLDPEALARRELMAKQLYVNSIAPQQEEHSWTQGAARVMQSLAATLQQNQVEKDREAYKQQQAEGFGKLVQGLQGGASGFNPESISSLPPNQQLMALQLMNQQQERAAKREDSAFDRNADFELKKKLMEANPRNYASIKQREADEVLADPNAPEEVKRGAQQELQRVGSLNSRMTPEQKVDTARDIKRGELLETDAVKKESEIADAGLNAADNKQRMSIVQQAIESGDIDNLNTTDAGKALQTIFARSGLPNDTAAISTFLQSAKQQLVDARKQLAGQGQVSNYEGKLLENTVLKENDTMEAVKAKTFVFNQIYDRQQALADLQSQWNKRYGSTTKPAENGKTFRDVVTELYKQRPLVSYEDAMKKKQEAASQGIAR